MKIKKLIIIITFSLLLIFNFKLYAFKIIRICISGNDVHLYWQKADDTCNAFLEYEIYAQQNELSAYNFIANNTIRSLNDYIHVGAKSISLNWKYYIKAKYNCKGVNFEIFSDTLSIDQELPTPIQIDTVSVKSGKIVIGWSNCISNDTKGYIIYFVDNNNNNIILDTIYGKYNTIFWDSITGNPANMVIKYRIAAIDSCENISKISFEHNNILLNTSQDTCKNNINIYWNYYNYWKADSYEFLIYYRTSINAFKLLTTIDGSRNSYIFNNPENKTYFQFYVKARNKNSGYTSTSNLESLTTDFVDNPDYVYLVYVTVANGDMLIRWVINKKADLLYFKILRGNEANFLLDNNNVNYNGMDYSFIDYNLNFNDSIYYYKIVAVDYCKNEKVFSNISSNILLKAKETGDGYILEWNKYSFWGGGVNNYIIHKKSSEDLFWTVESTVNADITKYSQNLKTVDLKGKSICFFIEAIEGDTNKYGWQATSESNIVCIHGDPTIFIPDAFVPQGTNNIFKPVGAMIDWQNSSIKIFNRWGMEVWNEIGIFGWNGNDKKGRALEGGVYHYQIEIMGENGKMKVFYGMVTMIK